MFKDLGYNTFTTMYNSGVISVVDHVSAIWGFKDKHCHSDLIQNRASRYYLGVHKYTPVAALIGEMGWLPCKYRKIINMLRYWNRLMKMPNDRMTKHVFNTEYTVSINANNWCSKIKDVFTMLGQESIFRNRIKCDIEKCKSILWNIAEEEWNLLVNSKPRLRSFAIFKDTMDVTDYDNKTMSRFDRSLLAKFRCGILQLHIETGRFSNTKLEERLCCICNNNEIEDEIHFLCICSFYSNDRHTLYTPVTHIGEDMVAFNQPV